MTGDPGQLGRSDPGQQGHSDPGQQGRSDPRGCVRQWSGERAGDVDEGREPARCPGRWVCHHKNRDITQRSRGL